jgi:transposase
VRTAKTHDADAFHRLRSVPGIGNVLALTILYEIHDITRVGRVQEFAS